MFLFTPFWKSIVLIICIPAIVMQIKLKRRAEIIILTFGFIIYIMGFVGLMFFPISFDQPNPNYKLLQDFNLIPFRYTIQFYTHGAYRIVFNLVVGNLLIFFPLGLLLPIITEKFNNLLSLIKLGFIIMIAIDIIKFTINNLTHMSNYLCNIDSLILNPVGLLLGYFIQKHIRKWLLTKFEYQI